MRCGTPFERHPCEGTPTQGMNIPELVTGVMGRSGTNHIVTRPHSGLGELVSSVT